MSKKEVIVIGAGPGGYVCALRLAQLGAKVTLIEKKDFGGTCLNVGCIPSKAMIESAKVYQSITHSKEFGIKSKGSIIYEELCKRRNNVVETLTGGVKGLLDHANITTIIGEAKLQGKKVTVNNHTLKPDAVVIATGSIQSDLPGLTIDHNYIIDSTDVFSLTAIPKNLAILGGGVIGAEFAYLFNTLGSTVTIIEKIERLVFHEDPEISTELARYFSRQGIKCHFNTSIKKIEKKNITIEHEGEEGIVHAEKLLVAVGRRPNTSWLKDSDISLDEHGFVKVNSTLESTQKGVYALGDCVYGPMLAHRSSHQGIYVAEVIMGERRGMDQPIIAGAIFTEPQIASVGITEEGAQNAKIPIRIGKFRFIGNGKAKCGGHTDGMVKLIADAKKNVLLGAHIIGANASELIHVLILSIEQKISITDLKRMVFIHPTMSEAIHEALLDLDGCALHK